MAAAPEIVTRFAPSPTGALHVGGARTALFNWALARGAGGRFLLRVEDTDRRRSSPEATRGILRDLAWLGLDWDEGPDPDADDPTQQQRDPRGVGPFFQAQRHEKGVYDEAIEKLRDRRPDQVYEDEGTLRFRMPDQPITVHDRILGEVTVQPEDTQDFVIKKSDGLPTYHFAVVVDDWRMGVTHVVRGQEHLSNTPRHWALQEALGYDHPTWAHIPLIFNPDGSKMSKRDKAKAARDRLREWIDNGGDLDELANRCAEWGESARHLTDLPSPQITKEQIKAFFEKEPAEYTEADINEIPFLLSRELDFHIPEIEVSDFRWNGYLPEALCNYLALLGWNPGGDVEKFDLGYLKQTFSLERVQKSNARFDRDKLASFNADAIANLSADRLKEEAWNNLGNSVILDNSALFSGKDDPGFETFVEAYRHRSQTLRDPLEQGWFFFKPNDQHVVDRIPHDKKAHKVLTKNDGEGFAVLDELRGVLEGVEPWDEAHLETAVKEYAERHGLKMGKVAQPLRVAVSGGTVSPGIFETLAILGREKTLSRIDLCRALRAESQPNQKERAG